NEIVKMFPEAKLIIEGHTDATGNASTNMLLSEKRAYVIMQYLRQSLLISAGRIKSIGFGSDKPVATNKTKAGRAMNRRIDIIIMQ
ncbi:MAG: OmpA family protein, partial [candidate division Zixibacteria bacterium]|nr:OmpA family protein [candidate division Zixibacteria bacterium]